MMLPGSCLTRTACSRCATRRRIRYSKLSLLLVYDSTLHRPRLLELACQDLTSWFKYSGRDGAAFEPIVDKLVARLISLIESKYLSTAEKLCPVEFSQKSQYFTLDVITELAFGEAVGFLANDKDMYKYIEINDGFFPILAVILNMPWLDKYLKSWPLNMALPGEGDQVGFGRLIGYDKFSPRSIREVVRMCVHKRSG